MDGEGGPVARFAPLALGGLEESRFLAADVRSSPELDLDVEGEARLAGDPFPQEIFLAEPGQEAFKIRREVGVFAPEVEEAFPGPDRVAGHGHALEQEMGALGQDDPVLECPGFAFVGVADDVVILSLFPPAELPFQSRRESRPPAAQQVGFLDFGDDALGRDFHRFLDGRAGPEGSEDDRAFLADVVFDHRPDELGGVGPIPRRGDHRPDVHARVHPFDDQLHLGRRQFREHNAVDESRGLLIIHPDAGGPVKPDPAVGRCFTEPASGRFFKSRGDGRPALHDRDDVVVEINGVGPGGTGGKEMIERGRPFDLHRGEPQAGGDFGRGFGRNMPVFGLNLPENVDQAGPVSAVTDENGSEGSFCRHENLSCERII